MTTIFVAKTYSGFHIRLKSDNPHAFRLSIDSLKSAIAPDQRSYNPATREWFVDEDATDRMRRWLEYCRANLYAEVEWFEGDDSETERTPPKRARPQPVDPYTALHLLPSALPEVIKATYRALAMMHHPDHGGDTATMQTINDAYRRLPA